MTIVTNVTGWHCIHHTSPVCDSVSLPPWFHACLGWAFYTCYTIAYIYYCLPARPGPARPRPGWAGPARPGPARPGPARPGPARPSPAQPSPAQPSPAQPSPAQHGQARPSPAQPSSTQPSLPIMAWPNLRATRQLSITLSRIPNLAETQSVCTPGGCCTNGRIGPT